MYKPLRPRKDIKLHPLRHKVKIPSAVPDSASAAPDSLVHPMIKPAQAAAADSVVAEEMRRREKMKAMFAPKSVKRKHPFQR